MEQLDKSEGKVHCDLKEKMQSPKVWSCAAPFQQTKAIMLLLSVRAKTDDIFRQTPI